MTERGCEAVVVTCIDYRFQESVSVWTKGNLPRRGHDRVAYAGGVKNLEIILSQISISRTLHGIKKAILMNHEDCGAYGEEGTPEKHAQDLRVAKTKVKEAYPDLEIETYYLHLDGTFEPLP